MSPNPVVNFFNDNPTDKHQTFSVHGKTHHRGFPYDDDESIPSTWSNSQLHRHQQSTSQTLTETRDRPQWNIQLTISPSLLTKTRSTKLKAQEKEQPKSREPLSKLHFTLITNLQIIYVIFKNRAGVLYQHLKHSAIASCSRPDKVRTASFLNVLWNSPFNTLIREEPLEIYCS